MHEELFAGNSFGDLQYKMCEYLNVQYFGTALACTLNVRTSRACQLLYSLALQINKQS